MVNRNVRMLNGREVPEILFVQLTNDERREVEQVVRKRAGRVALGARLSRPAGCRHARL